MRQGKNSIPRFGVCIVNSGYLASLELYKIYRVLSDKRIAADDLFRVIDESGGDYLFSAERFFIIDLPQAVKRAILKTSKNGITVNRELA